MLAHGRAKPAHLAGGFGKPRHQIWDGQFTNARVLHRQNIAARLVVRVFKNLINGIDRAARYLGLFANLQQFITRKAAGPGADIGIHFCARGFPLTNGAPFAIIAKLRRAHRRRKPRENFV